MTSLLLIVLDVKAEDEEKNHTLTFICISKPAVKLYCSTFNGVECDN